MRAFKYIYPHISRSPHQAVVASYAPVNFTCIERSRTRYLATRTAVLRGFYRYVQQTKIDRRVHPCSGLFLGRECTRQVTIFDLTLRPGRHASGMHLCMHPTSGAPRRRYVQAAGYNVTWREARLVYLYVTRTSRLST